LLVLLRPIAILNTHVLRLGRHLAWMALALMVLVILLQVVMRYIFNNALAWPDEAARFLMLWMTGLIAPSAFRWGGFVAIDMVPRALPRRIGSVLAIFLLMLSFGVLVVGVQHGTNHTFGFGGNFNSSSLKIPMDWVGMDTIRVKLRYMHASLFTGIILLISVNIELLLRAAIGLISPDLELPGDDAPNEMLVAD
jgi:TRAP-type C4-dicarboxylate transport system permease small subunit